MLHQIFGRPILGQRVIEREFLGVAKPKLRTSWRWQR